MRKPKARIKILRNNELVDPHSTKIRSDQAEKLKSLADATVRRAKPTSRIKLVSKKPDEIYTAGKIINCDACKKINPTKRMYRYRNSSRGQIILCERCDENAEVRSFRGLDALDFHRKEIKID
jgi:hypothetical protein